MNRLEKILSNIVKVQCKKPLQILFIVLVFTLIIGTGLLNIGFQTDFSKELPSDLPAIIGQNKINDKLGGENIIIILVQLDKTTDHKNAVKDIRDPKVMKSLVELQYMLKNEPDIVNVESVASIFMQTGIPNNIEGIKLILDQIPNTELMFNKDYSSTILYLTTSVSGNQGKIEKFLSKIQDNIDNVAKPSGIKFTITGDLPIRLTLLQLLQKDMFFTMGISSIVIFALLIILEKSLKKALLVFSPLLFGLVWTFGIIGLLGISLSIATFAIGAMILGLGVEYGVFMVKRYNEERKKGASISKSLINGMPFVGSSILGSATTTIAGFLALCMATMPMIQNLGITLALGIFCCLVAVIVVNPVLILSEERLIKKIERFELKRLKHIFGEIND